MPGRVNFLPWRRNSCQNGGLSLCGPFAVGGFPRGLFGVPTKNDNFWGVPLWHLAALGWIGSAGRGVLEGGVAIGRLLGNRGPLGQEPSFSQFLDIVRRAFPDSFGSVAEDGESTQVRWCC